MADGVPDGEFDKHLRNFMLFKQVQAERRKKQLLQQALLTHAIARRRRWVILVCCCSRNSRLFFISTQKFAILHQTQQVMSGLSFCPFLHPDSLSKNLLQSLQHSSVEQAEGFFWIAPFFYTHIQELFLRACIPFTRNSFVHFYKLCSYNLCI